MRKRQYVLIAAAVVAVISIVGALWSGEEPVSRMWHRPNALLFSLSVACFVSVIFWLIVVVLPEYQRRRILRENLSKQYQHFRLGVVGILLDASVGSYRMDQAECLTDYKAFKDFFSANDNEMWYAAMNGLQSNDEYLNELLVEIQILSDEMSYILNNVSINDSTVFEFFKHLSGHVYRLKNSLIYTDDHVKSLGRFVWEILAQWSFIDGQRPDDIVQKMIRQI